MPEFHASSAKIAVIVVNFHRSADTLECLDSLIKIISPSFDIFLADNGSGDIEAMQLRNYTDRYPERIRFIAFAENHGFAGAHNRIFEQIIPASRYEFILLLNNDTVVDSGFLVKMLGKINQDQRIEMVAARMMKYDDRTCIDNLGITFYKCGLASNRKSLADPLLGPCGGCALYTAELLRQVHQATGEYFDEQFFCYAEDTDLAWRAIWLGYSAAYADDAVVYHRGSAASGGPNSDFVLYHGIRNSLFVMVKDIPIGLLLRNAGWMLLLHGAILVRYLAKSKIKIVLRLYRDFLSGTPAMWRKRPHIIRNQSVMTKLISHRISKNFYDRHYLSSALDELLTPLTSTLIKTRKNHTGQSPLATIDPLIQVRKKFRFLLVGGAAALFYLVFATFLAECLHMEEWLASTIAWTLCVIPAYQGQKRLTFQSKADHQTAFPRYVISQIIAIALSSIMSFMLDNLTDLSAPTIFIIVVSVITTLSYLFQRLWVFNHEKKTS